MPSSASEPGYEIFEKWSHRDPRYRIVTRATVGTLILSVAFCLYSFITKEIPTLYITEPWRDDPYDALRSFGFIAIPVPAILAGCRLLLSANNNAVPIQRIIDLTRTCYLITGLILLTIASEWVSVVLRTHVTDWSATTFEMICVLGIVSLATLAATVLLALARKTLAGISGPGRPDWLDDGVHFLRATARVAGPGRRPGMAATNWIDHVAPGWIRHHPLTFLAAVAVVLALVGDAHQVVNEGYDLGFAMYFLTVSATGYYAFFAIVSRYLNLIAIPPLSQHPARLLGVTAAASIPLTEAFRQNLSWVIGVHGGIGTASQLYALTAVIALVTAIVTLIVGLTVKRTPQRGAR